MKITKTIIKFWEYINKAEFDKLTEVMAADANVILPNTNEKFVGRENYIRFNRDYPGRWFADVQKLFEADDEIVTAVKIFNKEGMSLYVTSFFKVKNGLITQITEYWGENGEPPTWRKGKGYSIVYCDRS